MKVIETRKYEMLQRIRQFGLDHADRFPPEEFAGKLFAVISSAVGDLAELAGAQAAAEGNARVNAGAKESTRSVLRDDLFQINRTAEVIALDIHDLGKQFRLPRGRSDQAIIASARGFSENARPIAAAFVQHGLPADFLDSLKKHLAEFEACIGKYDKCKDAHAVATRHIDAKMAQALEAAKRLKVIVRNSVRDDVAMLTAWNRVCRVARMPRSKTVSPSAAPQAVPAPPSSQ